MTEAAQYLFWEYINSNFFAVHIGSVYVVDLTEEARKKDLEKVFMKYGPLKEIWLASYAPIYAFVVFRNRLDAQVLDSSISIF